MISNHKDDIHPQGLLQGRIDRDIHPRGLLQTGRQKRVQAQEQPIAGLPKIDVPWKAGSSGSALSFGASVGSGFLVGGPIGAVLGAGGFIVSKMFSKDKPTGYTQAQIKAFLDKVSSALKTYSPEDRQKILASNDPVIKQYKVIRNDQIERELGGIEQMATGQSRNVTPVFEKGDDWYYEAIDRTKLQWVSDSGDYYVEPTPQKVEYGSVAGKNRAIGQLSASGQMFSDPDPHSTSLVVYDKYRKATGSQYTPPTPQKVEYGSVAGKARAKNKLRAEGKMFDDLDPHSTYLTVYA